MRGGVQGRRGQYARVESGERTGKSWGQASPLGRAFLKERKSVTVLWITLSRWIAELKDVECKTVG